MLPLPALFHKQLVEGHPTRVERHQSKLQDVSRNLSGRNEPTKISQFLHTNENATRQLIVFNTMVPNFGMQAHTRIRYRPSKDVFYFCP